MPVQNNDRISLEIRKLAGELAQQGKQIKALSNTPQLAFSSIEDGSIPSNDGDGNTVAVIGKQDDGSHTVVSLLGPTPPTPSTPTATAYPLAISVVWDGVFLNGDVESLMFGLPDPTVISTWDFSHVDVHLGTVAGFTATRENRQGSMREGGESVSISVAAGTYYIKLVSMSRAGKVSPVSGEVSVVIVEPPDVEQIQEDVSDALGKVTISANDPIPADGDGKVIGSLWMKVVADKHEATWVWNGAAWQAKTPESVNIETGTFGLLSGAKLAATAIDGKVITGAQFQTSATANTGIKINHGNSNELVMYDPVTGAVTFKADGDTGSVLLTSAASSGQTTQISGLGMQVLNEDGSTATQLGAFGEDYLSVGDGLGSTVASISAAGVVSSTGLSVENDPTFAGNSLLGSFQTWERPTGVGDAPEGWFDMLPRGIIARGFNSATQGRTISGTNEFDLGEIGFDMVIGRMYKITIEPLSMYTTDGFVQLVVYGTNDGTTPDRTDAVIRKFTGRNTTVSLMQYSMGGSFYHYYDGLLTSGVVRSRLLIGALSSGASSTVTVFGSANGGTLRVIVEDVGLQLEDTLVDRTGSTQVAEPAPPPEEKSYTKTYIATNSRSYQGNNNTYAFDTNRMYQGQSPAGYGDLQSIAIFPSMTGDLSGATITSVKAYFYFEHWYYNSGGTARIGLHQVSSLPSTQPSITQVVGSANWPKPGGRWVNIPSQYWAEIKSGHFKGLALGDTSGGFTEYGIARGTPKLEIKYKK